MAVDLQFSKDARAKMKAGIDKLAQAVTCTLGPGGRLVTIKNPMHGVPLITKDGVTVAKHVNLADPYEDMGAQMVKQAAQRTASEAGDGTTTSTLLAHAMITQGMEALDSGVSPVDLRKGMDTAMNVALACIDSTRIAIHDNYDRMKQIATISANNDTAIGSMVANTMKGVGINGFVSIQMHTAYEDKVVHEMGLQYNVGFTDSAFITNKEKNISELHDPLILLCDRKISHFHEIVQLCKDVVAQNRSLLIIAEDVESEAMSNLALNASKGIMKCCVIRNPGFGASAKDTLEDIATYTGTFVFSERNGYDLKDARIGQLGRASRIVVSKTETTIFDGKGDPLKIKERVTSLENLAAEYINTNPTEHGIIARRLARLTTGVATIYVGGHTDGEIRERRDRIEDAVLAVKSAIEEGIVPGGGLMYAGCAHHVAAYITSNGLPESAGNDVITTALTCPMALILQNAGYECTDKLIDICVNSGFTDGFDTNDGEIKNFVDAGIIDPAKVARVALQNAYSVACTFLSIECSIAEIAK